MSYNRLQEDRKRKNGPKLRVNHGNIMKKGGPHGKSAKAERHSVHQKLHDYVVEFDAGPTAMFDPYE